MVKAVSPLRVLAIYVSQRFLPWYIVILLMYDIHVYAECLLHNPLDGREEDGEN